MTPFSTSSRSTTSASGARVRFLLLTLLFLASLPLVASSVNLAWNANPETDLAGYKIAYGTTSGALSQTKDVGLATTNTLTGLAPNTTYYCAVQAYNTSGQTSPLSSQISFVSPADTAPEIAVERPAGTNLVDGTASIAFGSVNTNSSSTPLTFTVRNLGTANLTGLAITNAGSHPGNFVTSALGATALAPGASTTFTVTFQPSATGSRSAILRLASNDADENPFDITLTGTGTTPPVTTAPEIAVERPAGTNLVDGTASIAFGNVTVGSSGTPLTFTVKNLGTANLTGLAITKSGTNTGNFVVGTISATTLSPGASATFTVTFRPSAAGSRSAILRLASNDADENPFDINVAGTGVNSTTVPPPPPAAPAEIVVENPDGNDMADGVASASFYNTQLRSYATQTFTIKNPGGANLTGLAITTSGVGAASFRISPLATTTLAPGATTSFTVTFVPSAVGFRAAALRIFSNDDDESPFDIALYGNGVPAPEIAVTRSNGGNLVDGAAAAGFGYVPLGSASRVQTFIIRNLGAAPLTGLTLNKNGSHSADFTIIGPAAKALAPGRSTTFKVVFHPTAAGPRNAALQLLSNDFNESPFDINLFGYAFPVPEIALERSGGIPLIDGRSQAAFSPTAVGSSSAPLTFTVRNLGTANLTGLAIVTKGANPGNFQVSPLGASVLTPGASTTFTVAFIPNAAGPRSATLHLFSNDADERPFDLTLTGRGYVAPPPAAISSLAAITPAPAAAVSSTTGDDQPVISLMWIDGIPYNSITITKTSESTPSASSVEVSSDLVHWFSGENFTTVVTDNAAVLKVRDNTPANGPSTRHIRLAVSY
jgi:hypothetical protein